MKKSRTALHGVLDNGYNFIGIFGDDIQNSLKYFCGQMQALKVDHHSGPHILVDITFKDPLQRIGHEEGNGVFELVLLYVH